METAHIPQYVRYLVSSLVENEKAVDVASGIEDGELWIEIDVDPSDRGRIIGRQGRMIRSMRVLARAAAGRAGTTASLDLLDDEDLADDDGHNDDAPEGDGDGDTNSDAD